MVINFNLAAFEAAPPNLPKSCYIDILLFLSKLKPAFRLGPLSSDNLRCLLNWCSSWKLNCVLNNSGFAYISYGDDALLLQWLDDSCNDYAMEIGLLLGYPHCCCTMVANLGEAKIDQFERETISSWIFEREYLIINPINYCSGEALISHLPCSEKCTSSMKIAHQALMVVTQYMSRPKFQVWRNWLERINYQILPQA